MARRLVITLLALALSLVGLAVPSQAAGTATLAGTVTDPSGQPVAGASVALVNPGTSDLVAITTADSAGGYSLTAPEGTYDVVAGGGELGASVPGVLVAGSTSLDIALSPTFVDSVFRFVGEEGGAYPEGLRGEFRGPVYFTFTTDVSGSVSRPIVPGFYYGELYGDVDGVSIYLSTARVTGVAGDVPVVLPEIRSLQVDLVNPDGSPASADEVQLSCNYNSDRFQNAIPALNEGGASSQVYGVSGSATLKGWELPTGVNGCRVLVYRDGLPTVQQWVWLDGSGAPVAVELPEDTRVSTVFRLVGAAGGPYPQGLSGQLGGPASFAVETDASGSIVRSVVPGTYSGELSGEDLDGVSLYVRLKSIVAVEGDVPVVLPEIRSLQVDLVNPDGSSASADDVVLLCNYGSDPFQDAIPALAEGTASSRASSVSGSVTLKGWELPTGTNGCRVQVYRDGLPTVQTWVWLDGSGVPVAVELPEDTRVNTVFRFVGAAGGPYPGGWSGEFSGTAYFQVVTDASGSIARAVVPGTYSGRLSGEDLDGVSLYASLKNIVAVEGDVPVVLPEIRSLQVDLVNPDGSPASADQVQLICFYTSDGFQDAIPTLAEGGASSQAFAVSGSVTLKGWGLPTGTNGCRVLVYRDGLPTVQKWVWLDGSGDRVTGVFVGAQILFASGSLGVTTDGDNVSDVVEELAPNAGDGNSDGVQDADQNNVTSLPVLGEDIGAAPYVTLQSEAGTTLTNVRTLDPEDPAQVPAPPPVGYSLPQGLVAFSVNGVPAGSDQYVTLFAGNTTAITGYAKYNSSTGAWSLLPGDRFQKLPDRVIVRLTDGGIGDDDGVANGVIIDPGALAIVTDEEAPDLSIGGVSDGAWYPLGSATTATCTASDAGSGLAGPCTVSVTGGNANGVGLYTVTARAEDNVGNVATTSLTYRVVYRFDGFDQPINDPSTSTLSVFKKGSTVPVRFRLTDGAGAVVQPAVAPLWTAPQMGTAISVAVNEALYTESASTFEVFNATGERWQYLWSTKGVTAGFQYRIGARLDDGTTRYVVVGVR